MTNNNLIVYSDIERMGTAIAKSGLFGIKTQEQAVALMLIAQAEGLHPAIAARDYNIISGKPALKADAMLARFQSAGGKVKWIKNENTEVGAEFSHPSGGSVIITWTMDDAKRAGFAEKDNWRKFPRQMLRARVVSEGIRTVYPGVVVGVYTPEEVEDFDSKPINMGTLEDVNETNKKGKKILPKGQEPMVSAQDNLKEDARKIWRAIMKAETIADINTILKENASLMAKLTPEQEEAINTAITKRFEALKKDPIEEIIGNE